MNDGDWIVAYLVTVAGLGLLVVGRVYLGLYRTRRERLRRLSTKRVFEAVPTDTPVENPARLARDRAFRSIDDQFSVNRLIFVPLVACMTLAAMSLPFLDRVPATLVSVLVAVITIVGGVAARPFLENAVAGLVISTSRLVNLGDTVKIDDLYGTVEDITGTHTTIKLWDWRRYVVPNSRMLQSSILNYSLFDRYIWASVDVWVAYDTDLDVVRDAAVRAARESPHFSGGEDPDFWVLQLDRDGIRCMVAAWAKLPSDAWQLTHDVRWSLARTFREQGIRATVQQVGMMTSDEREEKESVGRLWSRPDAPSVAAVNVAPIVKS